MKDVFKKLIIEFQESKLPNVVSRDYSLIETDEITTLVGLRRSGKTYLLFQKIRELTDSGVDVNKIIFINFEDERLIGLKTEDLNKLSEAYYELYPKNIKENIYLFFDEIHSAPNWNLFLARLYEKKQYKIFITGSSSRLLSTEIATQLRGRTISKYVYPLSFKEFLRFRNFKIGKNIQYSQDRFLLKNLFDEFLEFGGYPQVVKYENRIEKESVLNTYLELIIYKDLVERYKIRNLLLLKNLIKYVITNISKNLSLNSFYESIKKDMKVSRDAVWEYFSYLEDINFLFVLNGYSPSLKKQMVSAKKVYIADSGFKKIFGFNISEDLGRLIENLVFVELKRRNKEAYYYSGKGECDFVIKKGMKITEAVQVCYKFKDNNKEREIKGMLEAMDRFKLKKGLILTYEEEEKFKVKNKNIVVKPVWKWLLDA